MLYTFLRKEQKYMIDESAYQNLHRLIERQIVPDAYGRYTVCNLYYDTQDFQLIRESIEKPCYKEKIRIRSYGAVRRNDPVFLELKRKCDGFVYKRRVSIPYSIADGCLRHGLLGRTDDQICRELDHFIRFYKTLLPTVFLAYERDAFIGKEDEKLRITFDENVRGRSNALRLDAGNWGKGLLPDGIRLMEIKTETAYPLWLSHALAELNIFPVSFSKYGTFYRQELHNTRQGEVRRKERNGYVYHRIDTNG